MNRISSARRAVAFLAALACVSAVGCTRTMLITNKSDNSFGVASARDGTGVTRNIEPGGTMRLRVRAGQPVSFEGLVPIEIRVE